MAKNGSTPTARKPHRDFAGYVTERRNLLSGDHNVILDLKNGGEWAGSADEGGRWLTLCNKHGTLAQSTNIEGARGAMEDATNFCEECRAIDATRKQASSPNDPRMVAMEVISRVRATLPESSDAAAYLLDAFRLVGRDMMNDALALELVEDARKSKGQVPAAADIERMRKAIIAARDAPSEDDGEDDES